MWSYQISLITSLKCHLSTLMGGLASSWRGWGEEMDDISDFRHKSFMHQLQTTHSVNKMYYLVKSFSRFIMIIRASIMERDQSSNRSKNQ